MGIRIVPLILAAAILGTGGCVPGARSVPETGPVVRDVVFRDLNDRRFELSDAAARKIRARVFVFLGPQCPVANKYIPVLNSLHSRFKDRGVEFFGVYTSTGDSLNAVAEHAGEYEIGFPVLKDPELKLARSLGAERLSQVVVVDESMRVRYSGQIDDQFRIETTRAQPSSHDLADALEELLRTGRVTRGREATLASGCMISSLAPQVERHPGSDLNYRRDIAPIVSKRCAGCHHPGGIAPFSLLNYPEAKNWLPLIRQVVLEERMPPWHAASGGTEFKNSREMPRSEREKLIRWIDGGATPGEGAEPAIPHYDRKWKYGKPDRVISLEKPVQIPAGGASYFIDVALDGGNAEDSWIQGIEVRPENLSVVHHATLYVVRDGEQTAEDGIGRDRADWGYFAAYTPGVDPMFYPAGMAKLLPRKAHLILNVHYTPRGKAETDRPSIGLYFAKGPVKHRVHTMPVRNITFQIPPGARSYLVSAERRVEKDLEMLSILPHAHYRGKSFRFEVESPAGVKERILSVPRYDFNWQFEYKLEKPRRVEAGSLLHCDARFDNSPENVRNPNPEVAVKFGVESTDEMMFCYVDYIEAGPVSGRDRVQEGR